MEKQIKYRVIYTNGMQMNGHIQQKHILKKMQDFEKEAVVVMQKTNCDHVLYGAKIYDEYGNIKAVDFCLRPMSDDEFYRVAGKGRGVMIYAVHNHNRV